MQKNRTENTARHPEFHIPRETWREVRNIFLPLYLARTNQQLPEGKGRSEQRRRIHEEAGTQGLQRLESIATQMPPERVPQKILTIQQEIQNATALEALRGQLRALYSRWHFETQNRVPAYDQSLALYNRQSSPEEVFTFATTGAFATFVQKESPSVWQELQKQQKGSSSLR